MRNVYRQSLSLRVHRTARREKELFPRILDTTFINYTLQLGTQARIVKCIEYKVQRVT